MRGMSSSREPWRLVRGGVAATLATAVAVGGHVVGGGVMPSWFGVAFPWWLSVTVCTVLAGSQFSLPRMMAAVLGSQALFHTLFIVGTPVTSPVAMVDPPGAHLGHGLHHGAEATTGAVVPHTTHSADAFAEHALHGSHSGTQMLIAHVLAAVVTALLLHRGETILFRCFGVARQLLASLRWHLGVERVRVFSLPPRRGPAVFAAHLLHTQRAVLSPQLRRGPPVVLAA